MNRLVIALAVAALVVPAAWISDTPRFEVYHFDSQIHGEDFLEVFRVHAVHGAIPIAELNVTVSGKMVNATWTDGDGEVSVGDRVSFVWPTFDRHDRLEARWHDQVVMQCGFGGGAGRPLEPETLAAHGALKCITPKDHGL